MTDYSVADAKNRLPSPIDKALASEQVVITRLACVYARRFDLGLRAPDSLHLAIARRLDATLVTLDRRLATAARELGIAVEDPLHPLD